MSVRKVAAHGRDTFQHEFLNSGNQIADELAKSLAMAKFEQASDDGFRQIRDIVLIQLHLVRVFVERESLSQAPDDPESVALHFQHQIKASQTCSCQPSRRIFGKSTILCRGSCPRTFTIGDAERAFLHLLSVGAAIPRNLWETLFRIYPVFSSWMNCNRHQLIKRDISDVGLPKCTPAIASFLSNFAHQST